MYSLIKEDYKRNKKAKEINKDIVKNMSRKKYENKNFEKKQMSHKMERMQSKFHEWGTYEVDKIYLSCFHDKQHIFEDGIENL